MTIAPVNWAYRRKMNRFTTRESEPSMKESTQPCDRTKHLVLLGDSIFDNAAYVPHDEPVVEQVREALEDAWNETLLAVDGHLTLDVATQLERL
jgi:hypothetical protein